MYISSLKPNLYFKNNTLKYFVMIIDVTDIFLKTMVCSNNFISR